MKTFILQDFTIFLIVLHYASILKIGGCSYIDGGNWTMEEYCIKITNNKEAAIYYEDPNLQCERGIICKVALGHGRASLSEPGGQLQDGTPCGVGGKCRNSSCDGSKAMDLDQICKLITGRQDAHPVGDPHSCHKLKCKTPKPNGGHGNRIYFSSAKLPNGTKCGNMGEVCQNGRCTIHEIPDI